MQLKGDLLLKLDGSGPLGSEISLTPEPENANCQWKALIREFGTKLDENFEIFLSEKCMQPGSEIISKKIHFPKIVYSRKQPLKTHKFVDLSSEIKSVTAEIIDLQVMSPQKK